MTAFLPAGFLSGSVGPAELLVVFLAVLLLFGPRRLPEIARKIGKALDQCRRASQDFRDQIMRIEDEESSPSAGSRAERDGEHAPRPPEAEPSAPPELTDAVKTGPGAETAGPAPPGTKGETDGMAG
jgi:TatA/E family protein of Tat protein translocase